MEKIQLNHEELQKLTMIRDPFLLVDEVVEMVSGEYIIGKFYVRSDLPVFKGHFPGDPTLPGIYILEAANQLGAIATFAMEEYKDKLGLLLGINRARFYKKVRPGDTLETHCSISNIRRDKDIITLANKMYVNGELVAESETVNAMR